MALITNQQITAYYEKHQSHDVTFNKDVVKTLSLYPKGIFFKCLGQQVPSILYSSSMTGAKIITTMSSGLQNKIKLANNIINLRYAFKSDKGSILSFFVSSKVIGMNPVNDKNPDVNFITLEFTQRPPDDLIVILGQLLDTKINAKNRKSERISASDFNMRKLTLNPKGIKLMIDKIPRQCIIRDLSFTGCKVIVQGIGKFLVEKEVLLGLINMENNSPIKIKGKIVRAEKVQDRSHLSAISIVFDEETLPMEYQVKINNFLNQNRPIDD